MEKRTPHYPLTQIQAVVALKGMMLFTGTARIGAAQMGLSDAEVLAAIARLSRREFVKSMTTHANHTQWQDVYTAPTHAGDAYVKFTLRDNGAIVISFKRKTP